MNSVKAFGAAGDGIVNDTAAIQKAIDQGGDVYFPPGTYLTGTLYLRSNVALHLEAGSLLLASPNPEDYNKPDFCPQNWASKEEKASGAHLIVAVEVDNVSICGHGRIEGNRPAFFDPDKCTRDQFTGWRPSQMLYFCDCRHVLIEDVALTNSPYWACFIFGCEDVVIRGVMVDNTPRNAWNGDGIDIDCSKHVRVSDCMLRTADDCLTVRASAMYRLRRFKDGICENVTITNCVLRDGHCGVRFGVGTGTIRNCTVSNCVIRDTDWGLGVHSMYRPDIFKAGAAGCNVHDILFDNVSIDCGMPFYVQSNCFMPPIPSGDREISGIVFRGIRAKGTRGCLIYGNLEPNIRDLLFSDIDMEMSGGELILDNPGDDVNKPYRGYRYPFGVLVCNASNATFRNFRFRWKNACPKWRAAFCMDNAKDISFEDCRIEKAPGGTDLFYR